MNDAPMLILNRKPRRNFEYIIKCKISNYIQQWKYTRYDSTQLTAITTKARRSCHVTSKKSFHIENGHTYGPKTTNYASKSHTEKNHV